jgi:DNA mismatch repair ATPase MutS
VTDRNEFVVKQARHPLQELMVDRFIPNDIQLDEEKMIMLITGQNGSGTLSSVPVSCCMDS